MVNWDVMITRYNFAHADEAYVHLKFLAKMSDASLPDLQHSQSYLEEVTQNQEEAYGRDSYALSPEDFVKRMNTRTETFLDNYERRDWLEWNYADWRAYGKLVTSEPAL